MYPEQNEIDSDNWDDLVDEEEFWHAEDVLETEDEREEFENYMDESQFDLIGFDEERGYPEEND
jgi:hypothetical protein